MAKRFIDTGIWDNPEFLNLSAECKATWFYLMTKCDIAGVINHSDKLAAFLLGGKENVAANIAKLTNIGWVVRIDNGKFWLPKFVPFQYGELSESCKPHLSVIEKLRSHGLIQRVSIGYPKGYLTLKDKEKDKEKDKDFGKCENLLETNSVGKVVGYTLEDCLNAATMPGLTEDQATKYFNHYNSQGWLKANKLPITNLPSHMAAWKQNGFMFEKKDQSISGWAERSKVEDVNQAPV